MWFSLCQVDDSKWRRWKKKMQLISDLCLFFHISLLSFSLQMKRKTRSLPSAKTSLALPCVCAPPAIWTASLMSQLILHRNQYVFLVFPLLLSNAIFCLWIAPTLLISCPSAIFNILFFPSTSPISVLVGFEIQLRLSALRDRKIICFAQAYEAGNTISLQLCLQRGPV